MNINSIIKSIAIDTKLRCILLVPFFCIGIVHATDTHPTTRNSVTTFVANIPVANAADLTNQNSKVQVQYLDGLGRPTLKVQKSIKQGYDLVTINAYNELGELSSQWLPTPINTSTGVPDIASVKTDASSFYGDTNPYSSVTTDYSLGQINTFLLPGSKWHAANKSIIQQIVNSAVFSNLKRYVVIGNTLKLCDVDGDLATVLEKVTDEDGCEKYVYKDMTNDRVLMQRTISQSGINHDTYYVYNDFGQLCFVLSPMASSLMTSTTTTYSVSGANTDGNPLSQFAYVYRYNAKGQCIAKKLPGKDWTYMVYDQGGRLAFSIESNQHQTNTWVWTYYKYDALNRLVQTGTTEYDIDTPPNYDALDAVATYETSSGYTYTPSMGANTRVLTENYYDTYDFINRLSAADKTNMDYVAPTGTPTPAATDVRYTKLVDNFDIASRGQLTGTYVAALKGTGAVVTAKYYNYQGQVVQSKSNNQVGGYDNDTYTYNFGGQVLSNYHVHSKLSASTVNELYTYNYDDYSRLTSITHSINGMSTIVMVSLEYDNIGRVSRKTIHGGMQAIDYGYNVRSQLKSITSPKFSEQINYTNDDPLAPEAFNGNISSIKFGAGSVYKYKFAYTYDKMNRLKTADYTDLLNQTNTGAFTEKVDDIDLNSNIISLKRSGIVKNFKKMVNGTPTIEPHNMDELTMEYKGNQLTKVTDGILSSDFASVGNNDFADKQSAAQPTEYFYDSNGNQTADYNKGIAWTKYNVLNLPEKIQFCNGNKIEYTYYADGSKKTVQYYTSATTLNIPIGATTQENFSYMYSNKTEYCGRYVYEDNVMKRIVTPAGYLRMTALNALSIRYTYDIKDHLGNTRVNLVSNNLANPTSTAIALVNSTEYYPSGMEMRPSATNSSGINPYLYAGNELDRMNGLNQYDFSARWYDYGIAAFTTMDPHAENHYAESPYAYCGGNPINRVDPTGMDWYIINNRYEHLGNKSGSYWEGTEENKRLVISQGVEVLFEEFGQKIFGDKYGNRIPLEPPPPLLPPTMQDYFITTLPSNNSNDISNLRNEIARMSQPTFPNAGSQDNISHHSDPGSEGRNWMQGYMDEDWRKPWRADDENSGWNGSSNVGGGSSSSLIASPKHTDAFDGAWGKVRYVFFGGNVGNARYDMDGNYQGAALITGMPPAVGLGNGVKIVQYGGHTLKSGTLKALQITKEEGKIGIEAMKKANQLPPDFHGNIGSDGSFWSKAGEYIDNIIDYIK